MPNGRMKVRPTQLGCNGLSTAVELIQIQSVCRSGELYRIQLHIEANGCAFP
jgi:hypothetical protein